MRSKEESVKNHEHCRANLTDCILNQHFPAISDDQDGCCSTTSEIGLKASEEIRKNNFIYRGEGNDSVVIALPKLKKVLRLKKCCQCDRIVEPPPQQTGHRKLFQKVWYTKDIMSPLLGKTFLDIPEVLFVPVSVLTAISSRIDSSRPAERKHKKIDVCSAHALLIPDACLFSHHGNSHRPTFAVEIKPKQGFLPSMMNIGDNPGLLKLRSTCRYSVKQVCKLKKKLISQPSGYCPVDLFSGCPERMKRALTGLIKSPQNNLRVFKNGSRIYGQGSALKSLECITMQSMEELSLSSKYSVSDWLCDILIKALCHHLQDEQKEILPKIINPPEYCKGHDDVNDSNKENDNRCCLNCKHSLPSGCILAKLLAVQKLDTLDISGIYPLYLKIQNILRDIEVNNFLKHESDSSEIHYAVNKVFEFLVSATAKDCSIIVKFEQVTNIITCNKYTKQGSFYIYDLNGLCFQVAVKVIDLDPKSSERIDKYFRKNREMAEIYLK